MIIENWRPRKCYMLFYGVVDSIGELNIRDELGKERRRQIALHF
jgi:hypothetical protein